MRTKSLLLGLALLAAQSLAWAEPPSDRSLERLFEVTEARQLSDSLIRQFDAMLKPTFEQALDAQKLTPEQRRDADRFQTSYIAKMKVIMADELSWDRMKLISLQVYRETFTQEEIDHLITFYESPTGRAFVAKMPVVMQKSVILTQQRMGPMFKRIQEAAVETAEEFKKAQGQ